MCVGGLPSGFTKEDDGRWGKGVKWNSEVTYLHGVEVLVPGSDTGGD